MDDHGGMAYGKERVSREAGRRGEDSPLKDSGSVTLVTFSISSMGREAAGSFKSGREIPLLVNIDILFSPLAKGWSGLYYENKGM